MSTYILTPESALALHAALQNGASALSYLHLECPGHTLYAALDFEHEGDKLAVKIAMSAQRHTMRLQTGDPANAQHLRDQLEAIANGTVDTAETGTIGTPAGKPQLSVNDLNLITLTSQKGGHADLHMGAAITVHAHNATGRTVIGVHQGQTWLTSGSVRDVIRALRESLQQRLAA